MVRLTTAAVLRNPSFAHGADLNLLMPRGPPPLRMISAISGTATAMAATRTHMREMYAD